LSSPRPNKPTTGVSTEKKRQATTTLPHRVPFAPIPPDACTVGSGEHCDQIRSAPIPSDEQRCRHRQRWKGRQHATLPSCRSSSRPHEMNHPCTSVGCLTVVSCAMAN
jgi:hypothetical protein